VQYFEVLDLVAAYIRGKCDQQGYGFWVLLKTGVYSHAQERVHIITKWGAE